MKTFTLAIIFTIVLLVLLSFPEESDGVVLILTHGKVKDLQKQKSERKRKRNNARKNRSRKKRKQLTRRKLKELRRWLTRFPKKNKNSDNGDGIARQKPIWKHA